MFGTVSGSSVSNDEISRLFAGEVEASASTGRQIISPIFTKDKRKLQKV